MLPLVLTACICQLSPEAAVGIGIELAVYGRASGMWTTAYPETVAAVQGTDCQTTSNTTGRKPAAAAVNGVWLGYWWADWCGACKHQRPTIDALHAERWPVYLINFDGDRPRAEREKITLLPTTIVYDGEREVSRHVGVVSIDTLRAALVRAGATKRAASPEARKPSSVAGTTPAGSHPAPLAQPRPTSPWLGGGAGAWLGGWQGMGGGGYSGGGYGAGCSGGG